MCKIYYCEVDRETGELNHFYTHKLGVQMCGADDADIVMANVRLASFEEIGTHWAIHYLVDADFYKKDNIDFIFPTYSQVQMCSPDFWKYDIENGYVELVEVVAEIF